MADQTATTGRVDTYANTSRLHKERLIFTYIAVAGGVTVVTKLVAPTNDPLGKALDTPKVILGSFVALILLESMASLGGNPGADLAQGLALVAMISALLISGDAFFHGVGKLSTVTPVKSGSGTGTPASPAWSSRHGTGVQISPPFSTSERVGTGVRISPTGTYLGN